MLIVIFILWTFVFFQFGYITGHLVQYYKLKSKWRYWLSQGGYGFLDGKGDGGYGSERK